MGNHFSQRQASPINSYVKSPTSFLSKMVLSQDFCAKKSRSNLANDKSKNAPYEK